MKKRTHLNCCLISLVLAAVIEDEWGWMAAVERTTDMAAIVGFPISIVIMMVMHFSILQEQCWCLSIPLAFVSSFFFSLQPTNDAATASSSSSFSTTDLLLVCILEYYFFLAMNKIETTVSHFAVVVSLLTKFVYSVASQHFYAGFRQDFNTNWKLIETSPMSW